MAVALKEYRSFLRCISPFPTHFFSPAPPAAMAVFRRQIFTISSPTRSRIFKPSTSVIVYPRISSAVMIVGIGQQEFEAASDLYQYIAENYADFFEKLETSLYGGYDTVEEYAEMIKKWVKELPKSTAFALQTLIIKNGLSKVHQLLFGTKNPNGNGPEENDDRVNLDDDGGGNGNPEVNEGNSEGGNPKVNGNPEVNRIHLNKPFIRIDMFVYKPVIHMNNVYKVGKMEEVEGLKR